MRSDWLRVREVFERALEEEPSDVEAWLAREAPDNPNVRAEVRSLLVHHSTAGRFLNAPVSERFPSLLNEDDPYVAGHVIGHYTIVRLLGHGGMGWVYLATEARLGRKVALKAVAPRFVGDSSQKERLRREARTMAKPNHPGICTVFELYEHEDGNLFIASEYLDGHTLRDDIESGQRLTETEILSTARDLAKALAAVHALGIFHLDLKPDNVMRMPDGHVKIFDFGLARIDLPLSDQDAIVITQPGVLPGTPAYMAPEQLTGLRGDARSDVWAFGLLLYELASGVHPFKAATPADVATRIVHDDAIPIGAVCPTLPIQVCSVIERSLKKWPAQRFESAAEICLALEEAPVAAPSIPPAPVPLPIEDGGLVWWRAHQVTVIGLYFLACVLAWLTMQGVPPAALAVFGMVTTAATVGGVLRAHLLFVERTNRRALVVERRRTDSVTLWTDTVIAAALVIDGILLSMTTRYVLAALIVGLGIGILLARLRIEPSSADRAFGTLPNP